MEAWIKLNSESIGRDKIARLIQYFSRAVWDSLEQNHASPITVDQFKTLEYILSSFRKLLRFGKCLDVFYSSLKSSHYPDIALRITLTIGKLSQSLFLLADHIIWLSRTGLFKNINPKKWGKIANKYWLLSIIMNLARDVYEIHRLIDLHNSCGKVGITRSRVPLSITSSRDLSRLALYSYGIMLGHQDVAVDTIKNVCDLFIPLTALGYTNLSARTIGILGILSSAAGLVALIQPKAKLLPA
ncbi:peroxisomal membrane protein 11B [Condylostylus longicornis]|uniref:peroxisomal membrane protein 11B n=1 Tax=Condylostylus longicornis TaxID=2530218 RepID=UPI00244DAC0E|nr:peroxisomal membrane protein 11B [Condylostylus longicornis]XP_055374464.1 peroxisomal membrane protein 11B [Condylostylus longicornis]